MAFIRSETENNSFLPETGKAGKLRSCAGETLAETLVALLIAAIGLMMLAGMITGSVGLITRSRTTLKEYYEEDNKLEKKEDGSSGSFRIVLQFSGDDHIRDTGASVTYYENAEIGSKTIISYKGETQ